MQETTNPAEGPADENADTLTISPEKVCFIIIKAKEGKVVFEIPLTFGVVGVLIAPQLAAIGAIAALITEATVVVEKVES